MIANGISASHKFKFIFGKEERKNITIDFLDAFLYERLEHHITDITYKNTELVPLAEDGKLTRLDVRCDLSSGEQVDVDSSWRFRNSPGNRRRKSVR